ncbi:MAG TPA: hypothetical protein DCM59_11940 [Clostridium sp.]|nr:hypothetical protein [Clostridium sp.]
MNGIEFLKGNCIDNACILMEKHRFPKKIRTDFKKKNIVYMTLPNGYLTTTFPDVVIRYINHMIPGKLAYHIIAEYTSSYHIHTCLKYHLLIAENNMEVFTDYVWLPAYSINFTAPAYSGDSVLRVTKYRKGVKCFEI